MQKHYLGVVEKNVCTGCSACSNICPVQAISMQEDEEGFLFPLVDETKCTNCGLCKNTCPIFKSQFHKTPELCYAVAANDNIRAKSSSGGIFTVVAEYIIKQNGYVCGAAFDENWKVKHIIVDNINDLTKLRGSKYVQSEIGNIYNEVKKLLENGKTVFFTGTSCQVAGLYSVLNKNYDKLYTADLVCHGVPNNKIWQKYIDDNFDRYNIAKINFRDKEQNGWSCTTTTTTTKEGQIYNVQSYFDGFSQDLYLRNSCSNCQYTKMKRVSDFTMGDFWGIEQLDESLNDRKGTSLLLCNTNKAQELFKTLKEKFIFFKEFSSKFLETSPNYPLYRSAVAHKQRKKFFASSLKSNNFNELVHKLLNPNFDIGIMGLWYVGNYGGFLTYWALYKFLEKVGYSVILIDNCRLLNNKYFNAGHEELIELIKRYKLNSTPNISSFGELYKLNETIENFIVGSDQIWNYWLTGGCYSNYFLDFVHTSKNKIACSTSFGHYSSYTPQNIIPEINYYLQRFKGISVREKDGLEILNNEFNITSGVQILDPVFYDLSLYNELIENSNAKVEEPYIFSYFLDPTENKEKLIEYVSNKIGKSVKVTTDVNPLNFDNQKKRIKKYDVQRETIENWLYYIKNCDFVIADSFHAICFAIIYKKNFIAINKACGGASRFISLLSQFGLEDRLTYSFNDIVDNEKLFEDIDYDKVYQILDEEKQKSIKWLLEQLEINKSKQEMFNTYDIILKVRAQLEQRRNIEPASTRDKSKYFIYRLLANMTFGNLKNKIVQKKAKYKQRCGIL